MNTQMDLNSGLDRKNEGQDAALNNQKREWAETIIHLIREIAQNRQFFTVDEVRLLAAEKGADSQPKKGCFGAVFREAGRRGIIEKSGEYRISRIKANNAGVRVLWRSRVFQQALSE